MGDQEQSYKLPSPVPRPPSRPEIRQNHDMEVNLEVNKKTLRSIWNTAAKPLNPSHSALITLCKLLISSIHSTWPQPFTKVIVPAKISRIQWKKGPNPSQNAMSSYALLFLCTQKQPLTRKNYKIKKIHTLCHQGICSSTDQESNFL